MIANPVFADMLASPPSEIQDDHQHTHSHGESASRPGRNERDSAQEKVRSTLRSFVRDWSEEGRSEREACYSPCVEALERRWPDRQDRNGKKVLIPGCGLGRLAMEIAAIGTVSLFTGAVSEGR
jgi:carnosine N-methyltransferase